MRSTCLLAASLALWCAPAPAPALCLYTDGREIMATERELSPAAAQQGGWRLVKAGNVVRVAFADIVPSVDWDASSRRIEKIVAEAEELSDRDLLDSEGFVYGLKAKVNRQTSVTPEELALARAALERARESRGEEFETTTSQVGKTGVYVTFARYDNDLVLAPRRDTDAPGGPRDVPDPEPLGMRRVCVRLEIENRSPTGRFLTVESLVVRTPDGKTYAAGGLPKGLGPQPQLTSLLLEPGDRTAGWLCRNVPKDVELADLSFQYGNSSSGKTRWMNLK
jgi:hypothetical protein